MLFTILIIHHTGYGTITPLTTRGRVFCIFYSLFGIPLAALLLQATGNVIFALISTTIVAFEKKVKNSSEVRNTEFKSLVASFILLWLVILSFGATEEVYFDGVYGWFITLTTIGYGDVIPGIDLHHTFYIWIRLVFMFVGLSFTASVLNSLGSWISKTRDSNLTKLCICCNRNKQEWNDEVTMNDHTKEPKGTYRKRHDAI